MFASRVLSRAALSPTPVLLSKFPAGRNRIQSITLNELRAAYRRKKRRENFSMSCSTAEFSFNLVCLLI